MKQLLGMAREKKEKGGPEVKPIAPYKQPAYQPSDSEQEEVMEISEEELLGYAEFIGIHLPEEEDLLWIAEEGLYADLPDGWEAEESADNSEIMYINLRTGQRTYEHPCDEYYKQLVVQERRKKGSSKIPKKAAPQQPQYQPKPIISQPQPVDPLVKMQQEKELRRLEEAKKKEYDDRKKALTSKHESKKDELTR